MTEDPQETAQEPPRKSRSKTLDPSKNQDPFSLGTTCFYNFQKMSEQVKDSMNGMERSLFKLGDREYDKETCKLISDKLKSKSSSQELTDFAQQFIKIYTEGDAWHGLSMYPPRILHPTPAVKTATFILVELLYKNSGPQATNVLKWIGTNCIPTEFSPDNLFKSTVLKACCVCTRKRRLIKEDKKFWAILDVRNHFYMYEIATKEKEGKVLIPESEFDVASIALSRSGNTVKLFDKTGELLKRFVPLDPDTNSLWAQCMHPTVVPLPKMFSRLEGPYPDLMLVALNEALLSPDRLLLRALTHHNVTKVTQGLPLAEALFNIFSYAGQVNSLLVTLAGSEFSSPALTHNTVLRGNSHLTNMFKIFFTKFGRKYYDEFLNRIVMYIYSKGDLQLKTPAAADSHRAKQMVFTVINRISTSLNHIPMEMRHFASILKNAASIRFNSQQATYNTLSGFFCLRFISAIISNPREIDPKIPIGDDWIRILVPAAQLLMTPFNLIELEGKYEIFNSWNKTLREKIFPELIEFVFSVAVCEEEPVYQPCTKEKLRESLVTVMNEISNSGQAFAQKYQELLRDRTLIEGNGWSLATFIANYFEQNMSAPKQERK